MKKILSIVLAAIMLCTFMAACGETPDTPDTSDAETLKFGLGVVANYGTAKAADGDTNGSGEVVTTAVAVLLDAEGKIVKIDLDSAQIKGGWTSAGAAVAPTNLKTKYELGNDYNMATYGASQDHNGDGKVLEWYAQVDAFVATATGKTLAEVKAFVAEDGYTTGDLATAGCTINVYEFITALEKAVAAAADSQATAADALNVALVSSASTKDATDEAAGQVEVNTTVVAAVVNTEGKIVVAETDCAQGKMGFDVAGVPAEGETAIQTKRELGDNYNMATYGASQDRNGDGKVLEWYAQADAFDATIVGKAAADLAGFADADGYGTGDLATAGCTIGVTDMIAAAVKAATVA